MSAPVKPRGRRERLSSINDPRSKHMYQAKRNTPPAPPSPPAARTAPVQTCCEAPNISSDEQGTVCYNCGRVLDQGNIVAEVTFGENAAGAAIVQGGFVGENQRYANTMGANMRGINSVESRVQTENRGANEIAALGGALNLSDSVKANAMSWYKLALNHNFVQGRRVRNVAAVALYLAARKQPENTLMLMDLAEKIMCNVWALGDTYKQFCKTIMETDPAQLAGNRTVQEIEPLMLKFCRKLEFGEDSYRVAGDAVMLLKRMKRDWMVQGRNPAGLCGACIVLAARMNNFRRTVREVVYVVKVADTTINQRLYEYKRTPTSDLTVQQFRDHGHKLKVKTLPPAIYRRAEKEQRAEERKRKAAEMLAANAEAEEGEIGDQAGGTSSQPTSSEKRKRHPTRATKKQKLVKGRPKAVPSQAENNDVSDQAVVPDIEALAGQSEAALDALAEANDAGDVDVDDEDVVVPKKRGRPPKKTKPIIIPDEDLDIEREIEDEITETVKDWDATFQEFEHNENHEILVQAGDRARMLTQLHMPNANINDDLEIGAEEFEDDPDVANCVLSQREREFKERLWVCISSYTILVWQTLIPFPKFRSRKTKTGSASNNKKLSPKILKRHKANRPK
jgi:transcription factor IIIB subunit 2